MKIIQYIISIFALFLFISSNAQSLSYEDLINLQQNNLEKANGFFSYKGFTWYSSEKDKEGAFRRNEYDLSYDRVIWINNSEEVQYLTKAKYKNIIIYYTNDYNFSEVENEAKSKLKQNKSNVTENLLSTSYTGQNIQITFNTKKIKKYYSQKTVYEICVFNYTDVDKRISKLCSNCKGKGQIIEHEKCRYCSGDGKKDCDNCKGKGKLFCKYCKDGQVQCNVCLGNGKLKCSKCGGAGTIICPVCKGAGRTAGAMGIPMQNICSYCSGKGKLTCTSCSGTGISTLTCTSCSGTGKVICSYCKGNYSETCTKCNGTGNTDLVCSYCNGKGTTSKEINKVCPVCNGSKLKSLPIE